jgi:beta-xylosidase
MIGFVELFLLIILVKKISQSINFFSCYCQNSVKIMQKCFTNLPKEYLQSRLSTSSDERKTLTSSSSNHSDSKKDYQLTLKTVEELNSHFAPLCIGNAQIDRQISDEGYRSVQNEQQQQVTGTISNHNSPLLIRSKSYESTFKCSK